MQSLLQDFGPNVKVIIESVSNAANGTVNRRGLLREGKTLADMVSMEKEGLAGIENPTMFIPWKRDMTDVFSRKLRERVLLKNVRAIDRQQLTTVR